MIAVIKYNAGNVKSLIDTLDRIGVESVLTDDPEQIAAAEKVIFPGVGEARSAMNHLRDKKLDRVVKSLKQPFLGICLGMQLMCEYSEENKTKGLGIFNETVRRFPPKELVPHMGWNCFVSHGSRLFDGISVTENMYFVHSYFVEKGSHTIGVTDYMLPFSSALHKDNYYGVQFHPEKSADVGQKLIENFLTGDES